MSGRMVQRVLRMQQKEKEKEKEAAVLQEEEEEEKEEDISNHKAATNIFDLLQSQDEPDDEPDSVEDGNLSADASNQKPCFSSAPALSKKTKKKCKAKKRGKTKVATEVEPAVNDVEQILEELAIKENLGNPSHAITSPFKSEAEDILGINPKLLRAENELKRIFGSKVVNAVDRNTGSGSNMGGMRQRSGGARRMNRGNPLRRTILVTPMDYWPRWDGSISMEWTGAKDGLQIFRYTFSSSYMEVQQKFEVSGASYDPNTIAMLLAHHPYHLESLLALSEVYKQLGEYQQSIDCLERCLFALECAWHPWFNPFQSTTCRLPYASETNRPFFAALFKHMQHAGRRGCHRSALEICKLLLSLDSDDPLGSLFCIDYFSLRAEQYEWLEHFAEYYRKDGSLALLPNFSFSLAVARFYLEKDATAESIKSGTERVSSDSVNSGTERVSSVDLLKQALMLHPATLKEIIERAPIKETPEWVRIIRHPHFSRATAGGPSLEHLIRIYVERNYLIWRIPELQSWLKDAAVAVIQAADGKSGEVVNWACVRKEAFQSENNEYRHLHLPDFSDSAPTLPPEQLQHMLFHGDGDRMLGGDDGVANEGHQIPGLDGRNGLMVFLQSLLPWVDYGIDLHGQDPQLMGGEADDAENEH